MMIHEMEITQFDCLSSEFVDVAVKKEIFTCKLYLQKFNTEVREEV